MTAELEKLQTVMNAALPRFLKSAYRREPLPSFLITIGIVDAAIGGFDSSWSLLSVGLATVGVTLVLRWWLIQQRRPEPSESTPQYYLPSRSSRPALPQLTPARKYPPQ